MDWRPNFSHSSPYYLKLSIACMHVVGGVWPVVHTPTTQPMPEQKHNDYGGMETNATFFGTGLWSSILYVTIPLNVTSSNTTTTDYVHHNWMLAQNVLQGGTAVACVPIIIACILVLAAMLPCVIHSGFHSNVARAMVLTIGYSVTCMHLGVSIVVRILNRSSGLSESRVGVVLSVAMLHIATHVIHHTTTEVGGMSRKTRRGGNHLVIANPLLWGGMCAIHLIALLVGGGRGCREFSSYADIIAVHAIMAFVPEMMGVMYSRYVRIIASLMGTWAVEY